MVPIRATIYDLIYMKETCDRVFGVGNYNWSALEQAKKSSRFA
jgi:hypothetical protein